MSGDEVNVLGLLLRDMEEIQWEQPKSWFVTLSLKKAKSAPLDFENSGHHWTEGSMDQDTAVQIWEENLKSASLATNLTLFLQATVLALFQ